MREKRKEGGVEAVAKNLLTSGEFASLRGVNLNSMRYYEKIELLKPAWVDPQTKYRYYRLEQLSDLDTILFFIEVGMPLKTLKNYVGADGCLDQAGVLRDGRKAMKDKIEQMQSKLAVTEFDLMNLERNRWCNEQEGIFTREIEERRFITAPFRGEWNDPVRREKAAMALFREAHEAGMLPTFPAGILVDADGDGAEYSFFVQVLRPAPGDGRVITIPAGRYSCMQTELVWNLDIPKLIKENFPNAAGPVIMTAILRDTNRPASRHVEIQAR